VVVDQRPCIICQLLLRHPAEVGERTLHVSKPSRLPIMAETPDMATMRVAQRRHEQVNPYSLAAYRDPHLAKVDLQPASRRRLEAQRCPRLGTQLEP
jgi:hypothetical protein